MCFFKNPQPFKQKQKKKLEYKGMKRTFENGITLYENIKTFIK